MKIPGQFHAEINSIVHIVDPNAPSHSVGFNPLARPDALTDLSVLAGVTLEAFSRAWGGEDMTAKPTIERVLTVTFTALADLDLTLVEALPLLDRRDRHGLRAYAIETVRDRYARDELERLHDLSLDERRRHDFDLEVVGPVNRLARFVRPRAIRAMIGQTDRLLDFQTAFDESHIILVGLSGGAAVYERDADLLGRLLTRALFFHAKRRARPERPFFVYLDECHRYLSGDIESILAELRKYGIGVILSHQWLQQIQNDDETMLSAVRNATNTKIVFRIKDPNEAEDLARAVLPLDLEIPVRALVSPTVVGYRRTRFENESTGTQSSRSTMRGEASGETRAYGVSVGRTTSDGTGRTIGRSRSRGENSAEGWSAGFSQGESATTGTSLMSVATSGVSASTDVVMMPTGEPGVFMPAETPVVLSESAGEAIANSNSTGTGSSTTRGTSASTSLSLNTSRGRSSANSESDSQSITSSTAHGVAESRMHAQTSSHFVSEGETLGESASRGSSEALEPILEDRPSSVHCRENVLHVAAEALRALPTGRAYVSYVGKVGLVSAALSVPHVAEHPLSNDAFQELRQRLLAASPSAMPADVAAARVEERERKFLRRRSVQEIDDEPKTFRVASRSAATSRDATEPVATGRDTSGKDEAQTPRLDEHPLIVGRRKGATARRSQGSRPPEATAQSAALDSDVPRPKKADRATNGVSRGSREV